MWNLFLVLDPHSIQGSHFHGSISANHDRETVIQKAREIAMEYNLPVRIRSLSITGKDTELVVYQRRDPFQETSE